MNRPVTFSVPTTFKVRETICPGCYGEGRNTGQDEGGFYATGICEECEGRMVVDASCACCDRIVAIDGHGLCRDCSDPLVEVLQHSSGGIWL